MQIPTTGWASYLRIRVYIVLVAGSCRVQKSFDRSSLVLICPICLICGLQADLCPQWKVGIVFTHHSPSCRYVVAEASRNSVLEDCGRRIKFKIRASRSFHWACYFLTLPDKVLAVTFQGWRRSRNHRN